MRFYRVRQFMWAVMSRVNEEDIKYINNYLDEDERKLFFSLAASEQKHSVRVAHQVEKLMKALSDKDKSKINRNMMIKAALLHDIGKIEKSVNIIDKSLLVIFNKLSGGRIKRFTNVKKIDVYYNHGKKGYNLLSNLNKYDERFLFLVRNHHDNDIIGDVELEILRRADSLS